MEGVRTTVQTVTVGPEENGRKLLSFLQARLGALPGGLLMRLVRSGQVRIDGRRCKPFDRVVTGQQVRIPPVTVVRKEAEDSPAWILDIVYEDSDMVIVNKPAGLPVHGGTGWTDSVYDRMKKGQTFAPIPVHRLDRDTSGLLVCAKTHDFLRAMHQSWPDVTKAYVCWVEGIWMHQGWRTVVSDMGKARVGSGELMMSGHGKQAVTHIHPILQRASASLLLVTLGTGRTHQIRVHMAESGHPIVGDPKYGQGHGLLLHALALSWAGHERMAPPPWTGIYRVSDDDIAMIQTILSTAPAKERIA